MSTTGRMFSATERAIARIRAGAGVRAAARDEGIAPSTLYRQLQRLGESTRLRTVIVGAGALARELHGWLRRDGRQEEILFISDDGQNRIADYAHHDGDEILIAVADPDIRRGLATRMGRTCATYIAASVTAGNCSIGAGSLLLPGALVSVDATIGRHCIVNVHTSVGHDVVMGDFVTVASHVDICGHVQIGDGVEFGSHACVLPKVKIGDGAVIGAGSVVIKDVPAGATVFGVPARVVTA